MNNGQNDELESRVSHAERIVAALAGIQEDTQAELRILAPSQVLMSGTLTRFIEETRLQNLETTDRLNGLIGLMDRHIREHGSER